MNSLTDRDVIDKISEACEAGVEVQMTIRGICCIKANVPGKTDGLQVRQIVGRFLEHARIYAFGVDADLIYLSSADMMTRNTERRVEIAYPVFDPACREIVKHFMELQHADNVKARQLDENGEWRPVPVAEGELAVNSQETLLAEAYARAREAVWASAPKQPEAPGFPEAANKDEVNGPVQAPATHEPAPAPAPKATSAANGDESEPGRVSRAFSLIGAGIRTLLGGK